MSFIGQGNNNGGLFNPLGGAGTAAAQPTFQPLAQPGTVPTFQPAAPVGYQAPIGQPNFNQFAPPAQPLFQQPSSQKFNLLGPINAGVIDKSIVDSVNAILSTVKNDVDKIIVRLLSEHQAGREDINTIFAPVNLQGCYLDIAFKPKQAMCPNFALSKQLRNTGGVAGSFFGAGIGAGLSVNGAVVNSAANPYASDPATTKMNEVVKAFVQIADMLSKINVPDSYEIRTNTANVSYIANTGVLMLVPSTLILNDNKNDARKLSAKI